MIAIIRRPHVARTLPACLTVLLMAAIVLMPASIADASVAVPADPATHGYVGLCGVDNRPMVGGSINDKPFAWKAIASQPASAEARGAGPVATLYIYQPRPNTQAADWSGDTLTATDPYSTPKAPTAQATKLDYSLKDFMAEFPPMVDGLYELRMYFGNARATAFTDTYAATFIQVSGDRWKIVQGGTADCGKGKAISTETGAIGSRAAGTPTASAPFGGPDGTGVPKDSHGVPIDDASSDSPDPSDSGTSPTPTAGSSQSGLAPGVVIHSDPSAGASSDSSSAWTIVVVVVAAVVVVGLGAGWLARRSRASSP